MQKLKLYLDCDGVILDTINKSYQIIHDLNLNTDEEIACFYRELNWNTFILEAGELNNAILKIKKLLASNLFDISILTHVNSNSEGIAKTAYFKEVLPEVPVISVPKGIRKADAVDPKGAILVDDFLPNLDYWQEKGGIPIKFSDSGKSCKYMVIIDLLDLLNQREKIRVLKRGDHYETYEC